MTPQHGNEKSKALVVKIIWFALFMSNCMLLFVSHFMKPTDLSEEGGVPAATLNIELFHILAAISIVLSQVLPRMIARKTAPSETFGERGADGAPAPISERMFAALFTPMVIELALLESVSIYGFILGYTQGRLDLHRAFFIVAIFFVIRAFPSSLEKMHARYLAR